MKINLKKLEKLEAYEHNIHMLKKLIAKKVIQEETSLEQMIILKEMMEMLYKMSASLRKIKKR